MKRFRISYVVDSGKRTDDIDPIVVHRYVRAASQDAALGSADRNSEWWGNRELINWYAREVGPQQK
jgi:hypothetical protein